MPTNEIEKVMPAKVPIEINGHGLQLTGLDEMYRWAKYVKASGLAPDTLKTPEAIMVAMQAGLEAGMTPMAALNSIAVVKGRPTWYSKAAKGRVLSSGFCKDWTQGVDGEGDKRRGWVKSKRQGLEGYKETQFSVADAKGLGLWGKNEWARQPDNMLLCRAIGRHVIDWYGDVMNNMRTYEEVQDADWPDRSRDIEPPSSPDPLLVDAEIVEDDPKDDLFGDGPSPQEG